MQILRRVSFAPGGRFRGAWIPSSGRKKTVCGCC